MPLEALANRFDLSRVGRAPARFDEQQMLFWQKLAVRALDREDFKRWLLRSIALPESLPPHFFALMQQEISLPDEALVWARRLEADLPPYEEEARMLLLQTPPSFFAACLEAFQESGFSFVQQLPQTTGRSGKTLFLPLRAALTGTLHGPDVKTLLTLLDAEKIKKRLLHAKESLCLSSTTP